MYKQGDILTEFLVRSGKDTTSGWLSDTILGNWSSQAHRWTAGLHKWPMTEKRATTTYTTASEVWDFEGYKSDSFKFIQIGGKRLQKLNFEDYQIFKEESPNGNDRVYSDFGNLVYINTSVDLSGTLTTYGQYTPAIFDNTDLTENTVFSEGNDEGNQAIIEEMLSFSDRRDGKLQGSFSHHLKAKELLDELWQRIQNEQYAYQTHPDRQGQYKRFDVLRGSISDEILNRDQF